MAQQKKSTQNVPCCIKQGFFFSGFKQAVALQGTR